MKVQDVYTIGIHLHNKLLSKGIWTRSNRNPEEFKRIWQEAVDEVQEAVKSNKYELLDRPLDIDWTFVPEEMQGG